MIMISFTELKPLVKPEEVINIRKKLSDVEEKYTKHISKNYIMVEEFSGIIKYLLKDIEKDIIIPLQIIQEKPIYNAHFNKFNSLAITNTNYPPMNIKISARGVYITDLKKWGDMYPHSFSQIIENEHTRRDLSTLLFNDEKIYNQILSGMNEHGQDILPRIKEAYNSFTFQIVTGRSVRYKIDNISPEEKEIFNIRSDGASLFLKFEPRSIFSCISNSGAPYGQPYPTFDRHAFDNMDKNPYILENAFMVKHYDDIIKGIDLFDKHKITMIGPHEEYLNLVSKIIQKYTMLNKI